MAIELDEARRRVLERSTALGAEPVALEQALGRRLAEDALAREAVQGFDNSAMDGFAVRAVDTERASRSRPVSLRLIGESRAGHPAPAPLLAGQAVGISTGAMLPEGADAVVRVEEASVEGHSAEISTPVVAGRDIRRAGEDIAAGSVVLARDQLLGAAELGLLASTGTTRPSCRRRPRVAVVTGGDELIAPGAAMGPGAVRNSNRPVLAALATMAGADVVHCSAPADEAEATRSAFAAALASADVVVSCGGISAGAHDHVRGALAALDVEEVFWRVALKAGGPTWFGVHGQQLVFGLPGNPGSALATFVLLARPALRALGGSEPAASVAALAGRSVERDPRRARALGCTLEDGPAGAPVAQIGADSGSHVLRSFAASTGLAIIPAGTTALAAGQPVTVEPIDRPPA